MGVGVYIKGMSKPKSCTECPFKTCFIRVNIKSYTCLINGDECGKTDCPLINTDLVRCGECRWGYKDNEGILWCEHAIGGIMKPTDFCSYGERRAEDKK